MVKTRCLRTFLEDASPDSILIERLFSGEVLRTVFAGILKNEKGRLTGFAAKPYKLCRLEKFLCKEIYYSMGKIWILS